MEDREVSDANVPQDMAFELMDGTILRASAGRVKVGQGRFGWWVGMLRQGRRAVWHCDHHHESRRVAAGCIRDLVAAIKGMSDEVRLRND